MSTPTPTSPKTILAEIRAKHPGRQVRHLGVQSADGEMLFECVALRPTEAEMSAMMARIPDPKSNPEQIAFNCGFKSVVWPDEAAKTAQKEERRGMFVQIGQHWIESYAYNVQVLDLGE